MGECIKGYFGVKKHKFQPRYNIVAPEWMLRLTQIKGLNLKELYEKIYICDVCVHCGKVMFKTK